MINIDPNLQVSRNGKIESIAGEMFELLPEIQDLLEWLGSIQHCSWFEQNFDPHVSVAIEKINKIIEKVN